MRFSRVVQGAFFILLLPAIISTLILYHYPAVQNCHFPTLQRHVTTPNLAPFRLLALGDPQLEGDTSLPDPDAPKLPSLDGLRRRLETAPLKSVPDILRHAMHGLVRQDIARLFKFYRKRLDLLGNDFYLGHIYRLVRWWTQPTHVVVLGDLLGSQWISDGEFGRRADRFWNRVFTGAKRVPDHTTGLGQQEHGHVVEILGQEDWTNRLINVAGNHDIGYAGDIDERRMLRFETAFGPANWRLTLRLTENNTAPALDIVILNSMNLDKPVWNHVLHNETHAFLDSAIQSASLLRPQDATILLTHIPLYKDAGTCVDGPFFSYFPPQMGAGIKEQNHLTRDSSEKILKGLFGQNKGILLNGHDHEGCDTWHQAPTLDPGTEEGQWNALRYSNISMQHDQGIRELTVRSMMGAYGGNAGLLSAWFDSEAGYWKFEYSTCMLGVQHIWWAVHVTDLIVGILGLLSGLYWISGMSTHRKKLHVGKEKKDT